MSTNLTAAQIESDINSTMPMLPYSSMVVDDWAELWRPKDRHGDDYLVETTVIWAGNAKCSGMQYYIQKTQFQYSHASECYFTDGWIKEIPESHVYPTHPRGYPVAQTEENRFVETPSCIEYDFREGPFVMFPRDAFAHQAELVWCLMHFPHRNVAEFFGCRADWYWMDALVFGKYGPSLAEMHPDQIKALNAKQIMQGIRSGVTHLHRLGIVHMGIFPKNIRLDSRGRPVIVNFRNSDYAGAAMAYESIELIELSWALYTSRRDEHDPERSNEGRFFSWPEFDHPRVHPDIDQYGLLIVQDFLRYPGKYDELNGCRKIWWDCRKKGHIGLTCCQLEGRDNIDYASDSDDDSDSDGQDNGVDPASGDGEEENEEEEDEDEEVESEESSEEEDVEESEEDESMEREEDCKDENVEMMEEAESEKDESMESEESGESLAAEGG